MTIVDDKTCELLPHLLGIPLRLYYNAIDGAFGIGGKVLQNECILLSGHFTPVRLDEWNAVHIVHSADWTIERVIAVDGDYLGNTSETKVLMLQR